jgi:hypothetical protein
MISKNAKPLGLPVGTLASALMLCVGLAACGGGNETELTADAIGADTDVSVEAAESIDAERMADLAVAEDADNSGTDATAAGVSNERTRPSATAPLAGRATSGPLFYGNYGSKVTSNVLANPSIKGGLYQLYWSQIETAQGKYDWSKIDAAIATWKAAGKGVALRIMWSSSGYWPDPAAKTPTPKWVFTAGARYALHKPSGTEVPLFWDPIYQKYAHQFIAALSARYDSNPTVMFIDATPGAETNPYRMGTIDDNDPTFRDTFLKTAASDGSKYSATLWWSTLQVWATTIKSYFPTLPVLITLNKAGMPEEKSRLTDMGNLVTSQGLWVGQNGLRGSAFTGSSSNQWLTWGKTTQVFFEQVALSGGDTGTMQELVDACQRAGCNWLNVYYRDALKATPGESTYDPKYEAALKDLASTVAN